MNRLNVLTDDDVKRRLTPELAVGAARQAVVDAYTGALAAPPRVAAELGENSLVFTVGGYPEGPVGFRVYGLWPSPSDQAVLVWDGAGALSGVVVGLELGIRRTGALGGVAVGKLARSDAHRVGIVGTGAQAWAQLWAVTAVRGSLEVSVYSPTVEHRDAFAARARRELGVPATSVASARAAVEGAEIIILATRSHVPVIEAGWVEDGTHVNTVGPKTASGHETPLELADRAAVVVADAPRQAAAYEEPFFTSRSLSHLGDPAVTRTDARDITLYCSTGLAGSEVVLASALLNDARSVA